jgi:RNA polymerase sigma-70 factor (ECF subfamily)
MDRQGQIGDELLVLRCQEGDTSAFGELVDRWQERLWRHAWRLTGDEQAAWDVLQEAWVGVGRNIMRLDDAAAFPAWVYRIVSNKCRDWIRRESRRRRATRAYAQDQEATRPGYAAENPNVGRLRDAVAHLPGPDRAILSLHYQEGFSTVEIADILGIPPGTVKSRLYHVRQRLRSHMEGTDHERR